MVREFNLINEKGQKFSLMDIKNYCLLTEISGLGFRYNTEYSRIENTYTRNIRELEQGQPGGIANFSCYDNFDKFANFILISEKLKLEYKIPKKNTVAKYYRDIEIQSLEKTEIQPNGIISEPIEFSCVSLWYKENNFIYTADNVEDELRWDFLWNPTFADYEHRSIIFENNGHVEAPFLLEMGGYIENPSISIYVNKIEKYKLKLNITIDEKEKLLYCTKDNELYLYKILKDGTIENLFNYLDLNNINFFKLPQGISEIKLEADTDILNSKLTIYEEYVTV